MFTDYELNKTHILYTVTLLEKYTSCNTTVTSNLISQGNENTIGYWRISL